ncbi:MAG: hypothetical protein ACF8MF_01185 [Phycisphaerales bacterium JB052]
MIDFGSSVLGRWVFLAALLLSCPACVADVLDDFDNGEGWSLILADGVGGEIVEVDGALRLDYDFSAGAGYCVLRRDVDLQLDPNYRFAIRYRGEGGPNTLEFKLIDEGGENVWWSVERDFVFPRDWSLRSMRPRHFQFAWGPSEGAPIERVGAIEIAVTATGGGKGSVWLDELVYERLPDEEAKPVEPTVANADGDRVGRVGPDGSYEWVAHAGGALDFRFEVPVEFSGIELEWADQQDRFSYQLASSSDGLHFDEIAGVHESDGGLDGVYLPEHEARVVRLRVERGGATLERVRFVPVERWSHSNAYFADLAGRGVPLGVYPKYYGALSAWTVLGLPDRADEALVSATGAIEPVKAGYSVEPFVMRHGRVETWADARLSQSLDSGYLPIPTVRWGLDGLELEITAISTEVEAAERVLVRYALLNTDQEDQRVSLLLSSRPFQVLPAAQFLNTVGGAVDAGMIEVDRGSVSIDGGVFMETSIDADAVLVADSPSGGVLGRVMDAGQWGDGPRAGQGPFPSAAMRFDRTLVAGESAEVIVSLPMRAADRASGVRISGELFNDALVRERSRWQGLLNRTDILVPASRSRLRDTMHANIGYILINADAERIQPGSRSYERSWIRDGAMTSAALIAVGRLDEARAFIEWYSGYQYSSGKVPCVVDARGPDPVDENDAPGEFIFAIRNVAEAGGGFDDVFARRMFPGVRAAVDFIEMMRDSRLTPEYTESADPLVRASSGLMPESISHEGYSAKPMHSYWDDFWVYRGLWDAVALAERLGEHDDAARFRTLAVSFGDSIASSVALATRAHGIGYVPGCVELGDFDATSTSIAYYPTDAARVLDEGLLLETFERAWGSTEARIGGSEWDGMTPYEVRTVGTFVRLGWVDRANAYMDWLLGLQDPAGWHQWGEIAYLRDAPGRFVGDMPHTWVGSGAVLSILSMFAYEDEQSMVLAAGVPSDWLGGPDPLGVRGLVTRYGVLSYELRNTDGEISIQIEPGCLPPSGYLISLAEIREAMQVAQSDQVLVEVDGARVAYPEGRFLRVPADARLVRFR